MLETIMKKQLELQNRLGIDFSDMLDTERAAYMRDNRGYLEDELAEALYEMPNYKTWKNYEGMSEEARSIAWQKVRMELIDALHFFINILLGAGMTPEEVTEMYLAKNKENHRRQDVGYTHEDSYRDQSVEEVMSEQHTNNEPLCEVWLADDDVTCSNDFITLMNDPDGNMSVFYNTDALSLGLASKMLKRLYEEALTKCSAEERELVLKEMQRGVTLG